MSWQWRQKTVLLDLKIQTIWKKIVLTRYYRGGKNLKLSMFYSRLYKNNSNWELYGLILALIGSPFVIILEHFSGRISLWKSASQNRQDSIWLKETFRDWDYLIKNKIFIPLTPDKRSLRSSVTGWLNNFWSFAIMKICEIFEKSPK